MGGGDTAARLFTFTQVAGSGHDVCLLGAGEGACGWCCVLVVYPPEEQVENAHSVTVVSVHVRRAPTCQAVRPGVRVAPSRWNANVGVLSL